MCEFVFMLYANVESSVSNNINHALEVHQHKRDVPFSTLGPLKANERKDLNCAVKEYLLIGGYRLTAMTFCEEVTDQGILCIGFLKRSRQQKEITRDQAVQDLEELERRGEEFEQLLLAERV